MSSVQCWWPLFWSVPFPQTSGAMLEQYWLAAVENHPHYQIYLSPPTFEPTPLFHQVNAETFPAKSPSKSSVLLSSASPQLSGAKASPAFENSSIENARPSKRSKGDLSWFNNWQCNVSYRLKRVLVQDNASANGKTWDAYYLRLILTGPDPLLAHRPDQYRISTSRACVTLSQLSVDATLYLTSRHGDLWTH